jgi:hypothetical protein
MTFLKNKPKPNPASLKRFSEPKEDPSETYWRRYVEMEDDQMLEMIQIMHKKAQEDLDREEMIQDLKDLIEGEEDNGEDNA